MQLRMIGSCGPLFKLFLCFDVYSDLITESSCFFDRGVMVLGAGLFYFPVIYFLKAGVTRTSAVSRVETVGILFVPLRMRRAPPGGISTRSHFLFIIIPSFFYCRLGPEPMAHFPELWNGINHAVSLVMPYPQPFRTAWHCRSAPIPESSLFGAFCRVNIIRDHPACVCGVGAFYF